MPGGYPRGAGATGRLDAGVAVHLGTCLLMPRFPLHPKRLARGVAELRARVLGEPPAPAPAPLDPALPPAPARSEPRGAVREPRTGKYDQPLVVLVAGRPGITVAEAAAELGIHPTALYPVIRRLEERRLLAKVGRGLHAPDAQPAEGTEQLWCEAGHLWQRPTVRGRKPRFCPEHR